MRINPLVLRAWRLFWLSASAAAWRVTGPSATTGADGQIGQPWGGPVPCLRDPLGSPVVDQGMDAEDLGITPVKGPSCEGVRDLVMELLAGHPLVAGAGPIRTSLGECGLRAEVGGLDFDIWIEPA